MGIQWQDYFNGGDIVYNDDQPLIAKKTTYTVNGEKEAIKTEGDNKQASRPEFSSKKINFNCVHKDQDGKLIFSKQRTIPMACEGATILTLPDNRLFVTKGHLSFSPNHKAWSGYASQIRQFENKVDVMTTITPSIIITKEVNKIKENENKLDSDDLIGGNIEIKLELENNTDMIMKGSTSELIELTNEPTNTFVFRLSIEYSDNVPKSKGKTQPIVKSGHVQLQIPVHIGDNVHISGTVVDEARENTNKVGDDIKGILRRFAQYIKKLIHE